MSNLFQTSFILIFAGTVAACQTFPNQTANLPPAPLQPAPVAPVSSSALQPIGTPVAGAPSAPSAPSSLAASAGNAAAQGEDLQAIPTLPTSSNGVTSVQEVSVSPNIDFGRNAVLGAWNVATQADSCALNLSLTTWTGGFRASTRKCSTDMLVGIGAWNVTGKQLTLFNRTGGAIARLVASGDNRFDGTTEIGGQSISVFR